jgi:outer membrane protein OmpA-like peptidoglycan-associated protein
MPFPVLLGCFSLGCAAVARAGALEQDHSVDIELFRPNADFYGYAHTQSATTLAHLQVGGAFRVNYSDDPLVLVYNGKRVAPDGGTADSDHGDGLVDSRLVADVQLGLGLSRSFSFTLDAPLVLRQDGYILTTLHNPESAPRKLIASGVSDLRLQPKLVVLDRDVLPIGLAVAVPVTAPTGQGGSFLGEENWTVAPTLIVEVSDASVRKREHVFRIAANGGYQTRSDARIRDVRVTSEWLWAAAMALHPARALELLVDVHGSYYGSDAAQHPAELIGGARLYLGRAAALEAGGGAGFQDGIGAPDYRLYAGFAVAPSFDPSMRDADKDGIADAMDQCPRRSEDPDDFEDRDGCPDLDDDADTVADLDDLCRFEAEDRDGFQDGDGCPDPDNDKDAILDLADRCPDEPETLNGYADDDGCPDQVPPRDTDGDGYADDVDRCPSDAEDFDGHDDDDGCPDEAVCVVLTETAIEIHDAIYFDFDRATIQERSGPLLDEIAGVILDHPELCKIRVEGHTDSFGDDAYNFVLARDRAQAVVDWLVGLGVERSRLDPVGLGEILPIASNASDEGRSKNRRVEFIIVRRARGGQDETPEADLPDLGGQE